MFTMLSRSMAVVLVASALSLVAIPATAHDAHEIDEWAAAWAAAAERGLTMELLDERITMMQRHPCHFEVMDCPQTTAANLFNDGVFRGKGVDVEPWRALVQQFFGENTEAAMAIMACESGGNPNAVNPTSRASGLFQFLPSTWKRVTGEEWPGSVFDGPTNIAAAAVLSKGGTFWAPWSCRRVL